MIIKSKGVFGCFIMAVFQAFVTYRDEFTFIAGCSAAFGKPVNGGIPQYILFPCHCTLYIRLYVFIFLYGDGLLKCPEVKQAGKIILSAKLGILGGSNQVL